MKRFFLSFLLVLPTLAITSSGRDDNYFGEDVESLSSSHDENPVGVGRVESRRSSVSDRPHQTRGNMFKTISDLFDDSRRDSQGRIAVYNQKGERIEFSNRSSDTSRESSDDAIPYSTSNVQDFKGDAFGSTQSSHSVESGGSSSSNDENPLLVPSAKRGVYNSSSDSSSEDNAHRRYSAHRMTEDDSARVVAALRRPEERNRRWWQCFNCGSDSDSSDSDSSDSEV